MVNIIHFATTISEFNKNLDDFENIKRRQGQLFNHVDISTQWFDFSRQSIR